MNKRYFLLVGWCVCTTVMLAQNYQPATPEQQRELLKNIAEASKQMKTLRCDFVQKKTISILADELVSEGKLSFKQADKLSWEYTRPYLYRFVINGNQIMIGSETGREIIDTSRSKMFGEISKIIIAGINGSGIFDETRFAATFNIGENDYRVALIPRQRDMRQMFAGITLTLNKSDYSVNTVEIKEPGGDATLIVMKNKQFNIPLDDEVFAIR
jgi:outer membrane lipoprotein carrier protein